MQQEQPATRLEVGRHGGPVSWSRESFPTSPSGRPVIRSLRAMSACLPSAEPTTASPPVRAGLHAPLAVKAAQRSGAPAGLGLDSEGYTGCARTGGSFFLQVLIQD